MFKLFRLNDDKYLMLHSNGKQIEGTLTGIIAAMIRHGVLDEEIAYGIEALEYDDMADYGLYKTFIFSAKLAA